MDKVGAAAIVICLVIGVSWVTNIVKLTDCDFESNYKCEVIHGLGIIPLVAPITVWFDTDAK